MAGPQRNISDGILEGRSDDLPLEYRRVPPRSRRAILTRRRVRAFAVVSIPVLAFVLGRISAPLHPLDWIFDHMMPLQMAPETVVDRTGTEQWEDAQFATAVTDWNKCIVAHGGDLPADPYRALLVISPIPGEELRWYSFSFGTPPRINPDLRKNDKWILFSVRGDFGEQRVCYADGTWARLEPNAKYPLGQSPSVPGNVLSAAGYPVAEWRTWADRASWLARNKHRLAWDQAQRMYIVSGSPASQPAQTAPAPHLGRR